MFKPIVLLGLGVAGVAVLASLSRSQDHAAPGQTARTFAFDRADALKDWTITGDVTIDAARGHQGSHGSLRVGPGGKALLKLRAGDASGKVEFWVHDDGTRPENPKASRLGPRWGLVQNDGRVLAVGFLYASYLGGAEGYAQLRNKIERGVDDSSPIRWPRF